jgi:hypothetical protein
VSRTCRFPVLSASFWLWIHASAQAQVTRQPQASQNRPLSVALCERCTIRLDKYALLGSLDGPDAMTEYAKLAVTSAGEILAAGAYEWGELIRFNRDAKPLGRVGRRGAGPGEQDHIMQVSIGRGDTIHILDSGRLNSFTSTGRPFAAHRVPARTWGVLPLGGSRFVVTAAVGTRDAIGFPLHIVDSSRIVKSFGGEYTAVTPATQRQLYRVLASSGPAHFWSAVSTSYVLERWDGAGNLTASFTRNPEWFLTRSFEASATTLPPTSTIRGLYHDGGRYVWVIAVVADENWKAMPLHPTGIPGEKRNPRVNKNKQRDTIIEVIDLQTSTVIASARYDLVLEHIGGRYLYSYEERESVPTYQLWQFRLDTTSTERPVEHVGRQWYCRGNRRVRATPAPGGVASTRVAEDECLLCNDVGGEQEHTAQTGTGNEWYGGRHSTPVEGYCNEEICELYLGEECWIWIPAKHPDGCIPEAPLLVEQVQAALQAGNVKELDAILDRFPAAELVRERHAIQITGCQGDVVAHFKLPAGVRAALLAD